MPRSPFLQAWRYADKIDAAEKGVKGRWKSGQKWLVHSSGARYDQSSVGVLGNIIFFGVFGGFGSFEYGSFFGAEVITLANHISPWAITVEIERRDELECLAGVTS